MSRKGSVAGSVTRPALYLVAFLKQNGPTFVHLFRERAAVDNFLYAAHVRHRDRDHHTGAAFHSKDVVPCSIDDECPCTSGRAERACVRCVKGKVYRKRAG
jgi:hypothetical protein